MGQRCKHAGIQAGRDKNVLGTVISEQALESPLHRFGGGSRDVFESYPGAELPTAILDARDFSK